MLARSFGVVAMAVDIQPAAHRQREFGVTPTLLLFGTGAFAGRIACDIGATAEAPVTVVIAGRNRDRLDWLVHRRPRPRRGVRHAGAFRWRPAWTCQEAGAAERVLAAHRPGGGGAGGLGAGIGA